MKVISQGIPADSAIGQLANPECGLRLARR